MVGKKVVGKKLIILGLVLLHLLIFTIPTYAADTPILDSASGMSIKDFSLNLWTEYDLPERGWTPGKPAVFTQYEGTFVNTTGKDFNQKIVFNVPSTKEFQVNMVCETENGMSCIPYELKDGKLSWQPSRVIKPGEKFPFMLEFYFNPIQGEKDKSFTFDFKPSYKIDSMAVSIKAPLKSSNFKVNPAAAQQNKDSEGFDTYLYQYSNITTSDNGKIKFDVSYTKDDNNPSKKPLSQTTQSNNTTSEAIGTNSWSKPAVLIPAILLVVLLVAFIYFAIKNNNYENERPRKSTKKQRPAKSNKNTSASGRERKRLRQMLLNGDISEETYRELLDEIEDD